MYFVVIFYMLSLGKLGVFLSSKYSSFAARKTLHFLGGLVVLFIYFFTSRIVLILAVLTFLGLVVLFNPKSPVKKFRKEISKIYGKDEDFGMIYACIGFLILVLVFFQLRVDGSNLIVAGFMPLIFGDLAASVFGRRYGRRKVKNHHKTLEGSLAMFCFSFLSLLVFLLIIQNSNAFLTALIVSLTASLVEHLDFKGFDNLAVPLISGFVLSLLL